MYTNFDRSYNLLCFLLYSKSTLKVHLDASSSHSIQFACVIQCYQLCQVFFHQKGTILVITYRERFLRKWVTLTRNFFGVRKAEKTFLRRFSVKLFQTLLQLYESVIIIIRFGNESEQDVDGSNNLNKRLFGCIIKGFRNRGSDARPADERTAVFALRL